MTFADDLYLYSSKEPIRGFLKKSPDSLLKTMNTLLFRKHYFDRLRQSGLVRDQSRSFLQST